MSRSTTTTAIDKVHELDRLEWKDGAPRRPPAESPQADGAVWSGVRPETDAARRTVFLIRSTDLVWTGARLILESFPDISIVGETLEVAEAPEALAATAPPPDLIITTPRAAELPIHDLLPILRRACPTACILVLAQEIEADDLTALAASGIVGYAGYLLWRDLSAETLRQCLGAVSGGDVLTVSRAVAETFLAAPRNEPRSSPTAPNAITLTPREWAVLDHLAAGQAGPEIAAALGISIKTVKRTVARLHNRFGTSTLFALGAQAAALGLLPEGFDPQRADR